MVIDTSAILARLFYEPECRSMAQAIEGVLADWTMRLSDVTRG